MKFTGERPTLTNEIHSSRIRYKEIIPFCLGKRVLDFGCGIGQGTYFLGARTETIVGYDCDSECVKQANETFGREHIIFVDKLNSLDFAEFNIVNMVEVLEHLEKEDLKNFLKTISKDRNMEFCGTTPNGDLKELIYRPQTVAERIGFHVWHYSYDELIQLFREYFTFVNITGCARDPRLNAFTGYTIFATNGIEWKDSWLSDVMMTSS